MGEFSRKAVKETDCTPYEKVSAGKKCQTSSGKPKKPHSVKTSLLLL